MLAQELHILSRGSWSFDPAERCQIRCVNEVLGELSDHSTDLLSELTEHKAVLFAWDRVFDLDRETFDEEHIVDVFGVELPNRECWDLTGGHPVRSAPEWETWALLVVDGPFHNVLGHPLYADQVKHSIGTLNVIALRLESPDETEEPLQLLTAGWTRSSAPFLAQHLKPMKQGWSFAPAVAIHSCPPPENLLRDWTWGWSRTCGPVRFTVQVERTAQELKVWLDGLAMRGYEPVHLGLDSGRPDHSVLIPGRTLGKVGSAYAEDEQGDLRLFERVEGAAGADGVLTLLDGSFQMWRSFHTPNMLQESAENSILAALLRGDLGEIQWDLFDGDYYSFEAQGPNLESLRGYLDPRRDSATSRAAWNLQSVEIDCREDTTWFQVGRRVTAHFGLQAGDEAYRSRLESHFATLHAGQYPRQITLLIPATLSVDQGAADIVPARSHIVWSFRNGC